MPATPRSISSAVVQLVGAVGLILIAVGAYHVYKGASKKFLKDPKRIEVSRAASNNTNITAFKVKTETRAKRETLRWLLRNYLVVTREIDEPERPPTSSA